MQVTPRFIQQLLEKKDLSQAFKDLEQNMDQESYDNFLKIKKESLAKSWYEKTRQKKKAGKAFTWD